MRNRALALAARPIPYIKELREITGGVTSAILMQQLDHWFNTYPDGFYKFMSPCGNTLCKDGESWTEELGFSEEEFRTAFDRIGVRHGSKKAFDGAENPFRYVAGARQEERFYASYHDKIRGLTWYFRNHELVDAKIDEVMSRKLSTETGKAKLRNSATPSYVAGQSQATETGKAKLRNSATPVYGNRDLPATELGNPNPEYKEAKKTTEKTTEKTPEITTGGEAGNPLLPLLTERYKNIARSQKDFTDLQWQAEDLRNAGVTVEELAAWLAWRRVSPAIRFITERVLSWREDQRAERDRTKAEAMVGANHSRPVVPSSSALPPERAPRTGLYAEVLKLLADQMPEAAIATWFEPLEEACIEDGILFLTAEPKLAALCRDFIQANYVKEVGVALHQIGLIGLSIGERETFAEAA